MSVKKIGQRIYYIRGHRVMLDTDLAELYNVETKALKRAVRRNIDRFPDDFMFQLTTNEQENLRCQIGTSSSTKKSQHGGSRYLPFVFTQEGVAMLSGVLKSDRAVHVNITIMRAFVKLREMLETNRGLARQIDQLERKFIQHDHQFKAVFEAIRQLMAVGSPLAQKRIKGLSK
jgi:hypothetical protein